MGRHKKQLTQEQIDFRKSILRGKVSKIKNVEQITDLILTEDDKLKRCFYYINNCVFWINEYIEGRTDNQKLLSAAKSIEIISKELQGLLRT